MNDLQLIEGLFNEETKCQGCILDCSCCPFVEGSKEEEVEERLY